MSDKSLFSRSEPPIIEVQGYDFSKRATQKTMPALKIVSVENERFVYLIQAAIDRHLNNNVYKLMFVNDQSDLKLDDSFIHCTYYIIAKIFNAEIIKDIRKAVEAVSTKQTTDIDGESSYGENFYRGDIYKMCQAVYKVLANAEPSMAERILASKPKTELDGCFTCRGALGTVNFVPPNPEQKAKMSLHDFQQALENKGKAFDPSSIVDPTNEQFKGINALGTLDELKPIIDIPEIDPNTKIIEKTNNYKVISSKSDFNTETKKTDSSDTILLKNTSQDYSRLEPSTSNTLNAGITATITGVTGSGIQLSDTRTASATSDKPANAQKLRTIRLVSDDDDNEELKIVEDEE